VHINIRYDEEQDEVRFQLINYSLSALDAQIEVIEIQVPSLSTSE
jgi:K+-transporting ATPase c subunit